MGKGHVINCLREAIVSLRKDPNENGVGILALKKMITLLEAGVTLEQLDALTKGEAWIAEWKDIETAFPNQLRVLVNVPPYGSSTAHFNMEDRWQCHSILNYEAIPDKVMTFNGGLEIPQPKEGE